VSPRARVVFVVAALAATAAVVVVGAAVLSAEDLSAPATTAPATKPRAGAPPLVLELGLRDDRVARALRQADRLYRAGRRQQALAIFEREDSLEAKLGAALAAWPGTLGRIEQLGALYPRSALVQLHVGLARFWAGESGALEAWREARDVEPDTPYAVRAGDLLHRELAPGLPLFQPATPLGPPIEGKPARRQVELLREASQASFASRTGLVYRLYYGLALQRLGRPVSARRVYSAAAAAHPDDVEALVADAVGRYSKESPVAAFSRLGPLSRRFPEAATVRFHLGLLLLWQGDVTAARRQLRQARSAEPGSRLAREAGRYLAELAKVGTG
jgi:tetratricopeptide (TPR) repeat protein